MAAAFRLGPSGWRWTTALRFSLALQDLVPDRIEDGEADRQSEPQNPTEVPHISNISSTSIQAAVLAHVLEGDPALEHVEHPRRIGEDNGQQHNHCQQHDEQRLRAARSVPYGEPLLGMRG